MGAGSGDDRASGTATRTPARPPFGVRLAASIGEIAALARPGGPARLRLVLAGAIERLGDTARDELEAGLALPGLVVVFACGIALYFNLPREPWWPATLALAGLAVAITVWRRRAGHAARTAATLAALALGVAIGATTTARVAAPRLDHERTVTVEGRVVELDATARGGLRMTVDVARMEARGLSAEATPRRITATLNTRGWRPDVGDGVRFKARLKPPEGPVLPGGYDFARRAWFEGRGAGGYVLGRAEPIDLGAPGWTARALQPIGSARHAVAERVRASLPGATGTIAAALMVGEQRAIPEAAAEPLRAAGLTHIVSISGLHMSLVAGGVIVAIRGLLALVPMLALGFAIKKWAAAAALVAITAYLLLSGNQVAALRSHLMLSVALLAVMVDRPAITMHTVAVSAALILAIDPAQALEPSFLMSYLAVIALVAAYDLYRQWSSRRPPPRKEEGLLGHLVGSGLRHVEGLAFSSLVAGLATAPVIAAVFFRGAPYSILANMVVLPVTGMVIMPAAMISALLMPLGLDHWPLQAMGLGIDWMIAVGIWTAGLPAGAGLIGAPHPAMMPLGIAAILWLALWRSRIRLVGLVPAVAALASVFVGPRPEVMVGRHGAPVAVRGTDGRLHILATSREQFDTAIWLAADGDGRPAGEADPARGWSCDPLGCVFHLPARVSPSPDAVPPTATAAVSSIPTSDPAGLPTPQDVGGVVNAEASVDRLATTAPVGPATVAATGAGEGVDGRGGLDGPLGGTGGARSGSGAPRAGTDDIEIAVVRHPRAFAEDCRRAVLVITNLVAPPGCRDHTTVIDRIDLARNGATTLALPTGGPSLRPAAGVDRADPSRRAITTAIVDPTSDEEPPVGTDLDDGTPAARPNPGADPPPTESRRVARVVATALPRFARPWTPVDPSVERLAREAAEADAAARRPDHRPLPREGSSAAIDDGEVDAEAPPSPDPDQ